jgi:hypothetical protein
MERYVSVFAAAILDYRKQLKMRKKCLLVAPLYSEKFTKTHLSTPSGSAVVVKRSACGVILPPSGNWKVNSSHGHVTLELFAVLILNLKLSTIPENLR